MQELENFYNDGFGWVCRRCEDELSEHRETPKRSRLMSEGEAESRTPRFSNPALARWKDAARETLICPRCQATESVDKS